MEWFWRIGNGNFLWYIIIIYDNNFAADNILFAYKLHTYVTYLDMFNLFLETTFVHRTNQNLLNILENESLSWRLHRMINWSMYFHYLPIQISVVHCGFVSLCWVLCLFCFCPLWLIREKFRTDNVVPQTPTDRAWREYL